LLVGFLTVANRVQYNAPGCRSAWSSERIAGAGALPDDTERDDLDALDGDVGERGCTWLAPHVGIVLALLYVIFFVYANSAGFDLIIFPMWQIHTRPPVVVFVSIMLGVLLTILVSWARHRVKLNVFAQEDDDEDDL
jgi:uncharacterized integral membrane protein